MPAHFMPYSSLQEAERALIDKGLKGTTLSVVFHDKQGPLPERRVCGLEGLEAAAAELGLPENVRVSIEFASA